MAILIVSDIAVMGAAFSIRMASSLYQGWCTFTRAETFAVAASGAALIVRGTARVLVTPPPDPETTAVPPPVTEAFDADRVSIVVSVVTETGVKLALMPTGSSAAPNTMGAVNPPVRITVTATLAVPPCVRVAAGGFNDRENDPVSALVMDTGMEMDPCMPPAVPVTTNVVAPIAALGEAVTVITLLESAAAG